MPQNSPNKKLENVKTVYTFWGRCPLLYRAQDQITFLGRAKIIRSRAIKMIGLKKGNKVLEVACGSGRNFPYLVEAIGRNGLILGFDYSQEMLDSAEKWCERNDWETIKLVHGDAAFLNINETNFDGVVSVLGMSAIPGWKDALQRCHDVLRPGGKLVVCDARLFSGLLKILNPLVKAIYSTLAAWDPSKNIPETMNEVFGNVKLEKFNGGTFFIAVSVKKSGKSGKNTG
ncbi:class I SAM-dependent methyltransferase [Candidatus Woesearchaeota archaeon]|nr:class I SAM-dependent methyltransferase [Candidatus Woesearchaeota archaeon]